MRKVVLGILMSCVLGAGGVSALVLEPVTFSDVSSKTDYFEAINWAVEEGIATGYGNGMWGPDNCVTRAELLKMIWETLPFGDLPLDGDFMEVSFSDVRSSDWYYDYVLKAEVNGHVSGYPDGSFRPNNCVNRAEAMKMATNVLFGSPALDRSSGPIMYDDKLVADMRYTDWFGPFARYLFKDRLVGTNHTTFAGEVSGLKTINFYPAGNMARKEVAEMLYRISKSSSFQTQPGQY